MGSGQFIVASQPCLILRDPGTLGERRSHQLISRLTQRPHADGERADGNQSDNWWKQILQERPVFPFMHSM
jgi:hypothetical protein